MDELIVSLYSHPYTEPFVVEEQLNGKITADSWWTLVDKIHSANGRADESHICIEMAMTLLQDMDTIYLFIIVLRHLPILFNEPPKPGACWNGKTMNYVELILKVACSAWLDLRIL